MLAEPQCRVAPSYFTLSYIILPFVVLFYILLFMWHHVKLHLVILLLCCLQLFYPALFCATWLYVTCVSSCSAMWCYMMLRDATWCYIPPLHRHHDNTPCDGGRSRSMYRKRWPDGGTAEDKHVCQRVWSVRQLVGSLNSVCVSSCCWCGRSFVTLCDLTSSFYKTHWPSLLSVPAGFFS